MTMTPLTLCMITKYPPIQGGVSQQNYWLAHNLARAGHRVHVVTNAPEVEPTYRVFVPHAERARLTGDYGRGYVRVHTTEEPQGSSSYIPYANPFVSKLAALARDVVLDERCDLLWTAYLEPYGVAGLLTAKLTGVPYTVRHAGSDIAALAQIDARQNLYLDVLRQADLVLTSRFLMPTWRRAGIAQSQLYAVPAGAHANDAFVPDGPALDVDALLDEAAPTELAARTRPARRYDPTRPSIGIYGKASDHKGMPELIEALGRLAADGQRFNLLMLVGTRGPVVEALEHAIDRAGLQDSAYLLPFVPHWMVPRFIRTCTAVCFLEHDFPIPIHTPQVGWEIMACGRCLVLSGEVRAKSTRGRELVDGTHLLVVDDPSDVDELRDVLARVLADPDRAHAIGARGREFIAPELPAPDVSALAHRLERVVKEARGMSLQGLERTFSDLYTDPAFRQAMAHDPQTALADRDLDAGERNAVIAAAQQLMPEIARFGNMLIHKRLEYFLEMFAVTAALMGPRYEELTTVFRRDYDFRWRSPTDDVAYFDAWLRGLAGKTVSESAGPMPHALADAARYDTVLWAAEAGWSGADRPFDELLDIRLEQADAQQVGDDPLVRTDAIVLAPGVVAETFTYPIHRVLSQGPDAAAQPAETFIAFTPRRAMVPARAHIMNRELMRMVSAAADGVTVGELVDAVITRHPERPAPPVQRACVRALGRLVEQAIVKRRKP